MISCGLLILGICYRIIPVNATFVAKWTPDQDASFYKVQVLANDQPIAEYIRVSNSLNTTVRAARGTQLAGRMQTCYRSKCTAWTKPVALNY